MLEPHYVDEYNTLNFLPMSILFAHLIINMNMFFKFEN
jgi:hypothetical protein